MTGEDHKQFGEYGVEDYLSDGVMHLVMERDGDDVKRKLEHCQDATHQPFAGLQTVQLEGEQRFTII